MSLISPHEAPERCRHRPIILLLPKTNNINHKTVRPHNIHWHGMPLKKTRQKYTRSRAPPHTDDSATTAKIKHKEPRTTNVPKPDIATTAAGSTGAMTEPPRISYRGCRFAPFARIIVRSSLGNRGYRRAPFARLIVQPLNQPLPSTDPRREGRARSSSLSRPRPCAAAAAHDV